MYNFNCINNKKKGKSNCEIVLPFSKGFPDCACDISKTIFRINRKYSITIILNKSTLLLKATRVSNNLELFQNNCDGFPGCSAIAYKKHLSVKHQHM